MVISTTQPRGGSSSLDLPSIHQSARSQQSPNGPPSQSQPLAQSVSRTAQASAEPQPMLQPQISGPSVVSRYMLPSYRQASTDNMSSSLSQLNTSSNPAIHPLNASLPDILHSHMIPQIPRLRQNQRRQGDPRQGRDRHHSETDASRHRHTHHTRNERRRTHSSSSQTRESTCKEPCVKCVVTFTSFRWVLVVLSILGVCCVVSGVILAALHASGSSFLFLAVMFIGLGILLVIVVSVGWKCTPRGHEPLHSLFHIGQFGRGGSRDRHRRRRHRHRDGHWFGGVMYPEFQYRRPPPSYAASMQDYHNQSLQELSSARPSSQSTQHERHGSLPGSPPPSYHSRTSTMHSGMNITVQDSGSQPNSRPPTYRSRAPSRRPSLPMQESLQGNEASNNPSPPAANLDSPEFLHVVSGENIPDPGGSDNILSSTPVSASAIALTVTSVPTAAPPLHQTNQAHNEDRSDSSASTHQSHPAQVHTIPLEGGSTNTDQPISYGADAGDQNGRNREIIVTDQPASPSSTSFTMGLPSSHENFESDVQQLEQALRPLELMNEMDGIDNPGANISTDSVHYDTYL